MPQITRTYETDMPDLAYQISRSDAFTHIRERLQASELDDQAAQAELLDLVLDGCCKIQGERGPEEFRWTMSEAEAGRLTSLLYREYLGAA
ncbi:MAG: hypothetical protein FJZ00_09825 [Candidatus Sericytochromatia bacterium]|uniref:Uncharacterized protein n=1 Tax=Candidatus Tanganyikabacteria bacterium TaxID=2961651 RepID=A0A937X6Y2_9BACT|nr:hypothetical protein [Candidatus Tanganyikabacteria bacterium]